MIAPQKIELSFEPEEYWDIYVTSLEKHKDKQLRKIFLYAGILLVLGALIVGILLQDISFIGFKGGLEMLMLLLVFSCGYLLHEISKMEKELRQIDIPKVREEMLEFIARNQGIESAFLSYDEHSFWLELDGEMHRHQWLNIHQLRRAHNFIYLEWEDINYVFGQSAMSEDEFEDLQLFLDNKFDFR